jgi:hypothetical protein
MSLPRASSSIFMLRYPTRAFLRTLTYSAMCSIVSEPSAFELKYFESWRARSAQGSLWTLTHEFRAAASMAPLPAQSSIGKRLTRRYRNRQTSPCRRGLSESSRQARFRETRRFIGPYVTLLGKSNAFTDDRHFTAPQSARAHPSYPRCVFLGASISVNAGCQLAMTWPKVEACFRLPERYQANLGAARNLAGRRLTIPETESAGAD